MAIKPFSFVPTNIREWSEFFRKADVTPSDATIGDNAFVDRAPVSIIGRSANTPGTPSDIIANNNNEFLVRRSSVLGFGPIVDTDLPATIARDSEYIAADAVVTAAAATALSAHVAAADPHTGYRLESVNVPYTEVSGKPAALAMLFTGTGSPQSVVTASVGALFLRTDGGASTTLYVKESGTATNTGWVAK